MPAVVEISHITKRYGPVLALSDVSLSLYPGEVLALLGDNGAGKSTLVKILSGALQPDEGSIRINGVERTLDTPHVARQWGIETIYQDLALALDLSIAANIFLGRERIHERGLWHRLGWLRKEVMSREAAAELSKLGIHIGSVEEECGNLSGGQRQAIAVARSVMWGSLVVLMDEPTAALGIEEQQRVLDLIRAMRGRGLSVMLITHNLQHAMEVLDRVVVLRRGRLVANLAKSECTVNAIVEHITGAAGLGASQLTDRGAEHVRH
jgi:simple sugar transport system ATP-binding protein